MKTLKSGIFGVALGASLAFLSVPALAQTCPTGGTGISCVPQGDIDLFTNNPNSSADNPNILFVLDNTANWSGNDQKFPGGKQGVAELQSIKIALGAVGANAANLNVGIMEFPAAETGSGTHGGYVRSAIRPMTTTPSGGNLATFNALLDTMSANFQSSQTERQNSNLFYGNLMADAHNYFKGLAPIAQSSAVSNTGNADSAGYTNNYTLFKAPPTGAGCGHNYIIFIANPNSNGPASDDASNTALLSSLGGASAVVQPPHALFASGNVTTDVGFSTQCYAPAAGTGSCTTAESAGSLCTDYGSCACDSTNQTTGLPTCAAGTQRYSVIGTSPATPSSTTVTTTSTATGTSACYATSGAISPSDHGGLTCPANTDTGVGSSPRVVTTYSCSYANGTTGGGSCPNGAGTPSTSSSTGSAALSSGVSSGGSAAGCYGNAAACTAAGDKDSLTCPSNGALTPASCSSYPCTQTQTNHSCAYSCATAGASCTISSGTQTVTACSAKKTNSPNTIVACTSTNTPAGCDANTPTCPANATNCPGTVSVTTGSQTNNGTTCTGNGNNATWPINRTYNFANTGNKFTVTQTDTPTTVTTTTPGIPNYTYGVTQTVTKTVQTTTTSAPTTTNLGNTFACYATQGTCSTSDYSLGSYSSLACATPTTTAGSCPNGGVRYQVQGINVGVAPTGTNGSFANKDLPLNANLWARYMNQNGIASTYAIDVYNAKPNTVESELYNSMAKLGGGKYYAAQNQAAIVTALTNILDEIQSVNSNFSSAALPISATNRAQNVNQVYIGMFRPNSDAEPRWYGNLKRYKLIKSGGSVVLGDAGGNVAVSSTTGFVGNCATSFWTTDSGTYWQGVTADKPVPKGVCPTTGFSPWSDAPDGPFVEKGGTAEVVRMGNGTVSSPATVNRNFWTLNVGTGTLVPFNVANTGLPQSSVDFITGKDVDDENNNTNKTEPRPSIHGDLIHSRPQPINYVSASTPSPATPIAVYYGSNDGTYRGIDAATGKELWAFVAPETTSRLNRLVNNSPKVLLYGSGTASSPTPKDYFFDGSTGVYQPADNSKIWIFPTMHRGGRMIYALDVTNPAAPVYKWRAGCPNLTDDVGCTSDVNGISMNEIGQTWSFPNVASIKGYTSGSTYPPVMIVGGGYDLCQDANIDSPSCGGAKGRVIYVLDAATGTVLRKFATTGGVSADVSLVDVNNDGKVDYAYAGDLGGNVWRINFVDSTNAPLPQASWDITRVAYTAGGGRKFLHGPAVLPASSGTVYLALGSGDREHPLINEYPFPGAVTTNGVQNRFYVYLDSLTRTTATNLDDSTFLPDNSAASCSTSKLLPGADPTTGQRGWFLNLGSGEQTVTSAAVVGGLVAFSTNTPTNPSTGSCSSLGDASGYLVSLFTGSGAIGVTGTCGGTKKSAFVGGGLAPSPVIATVPLDDGSVVTVLLGAAQKDGSTSSTLQSQNVDPPINPIRKGVYWRRSGDN